MPRFEAPSISITSKELPSRISTQFSQVPQGASVGPGALRQLSAFARMRAMVVFPTPRGPANRYAWETRPFLMLLDSVFEMWS